MEYLGVEEGRARPGLRLVLTRGVPGPNWSAFFFSRRALNPARYVGLLGSSTSTMSIAAYGHACAHAVQPVHVDSLITTSRLSASNFIEPYAHGSIQRWSVHVRHV